MLASRLKNESGYSLIEVMVAIMILALAIIPMVGMFDAGLRAAVLGSNFDQARALANEKLEDVRALEYEEAETSYPPTGAPATGTEGIFDYEVDTAYAELDGGVVKTEPTARGMMKVTVTVDWDGKDYSTSGIVAKG